MLIVLRIIGIFNAAIWLGAAVFFTFGIAPATFSPEMKRVFGDFYTGVIAQQLIGRYFALNLICGGIALIHYVAEMIYAGRPFRRFTFGLILGMILLGLLGGQVLTPKMKSIHPLIYRGPAEDRAAAKKQFGRWHAVSATGNLLCLIALVIYTWQVTNPSDPTRFVSAQKFRG